MAASQLPLMSTRAINYSTARKKTLATGRLGSPADQTDRQLPAT